jgi:hypothetical protein
MQLYTFSVALVVFFIHFALIAETVNAEAIDQAAVHDFFNRNVPAGASESSHTNNWAVLVCASRYWFNYRVRIIGQPRISFRLKYLGSIWRMRWECAQLFLS